jgi:hypothetical protein
MTTTWHADEAALAAYANGTLDDVRSVSLEAHLLGCDHCRESLAPFVPAGPLDGTWDAIEIALDAPKPGVVERTLVRIGVRSHVARLLAATPSLRLSWFLAEGIALVTAAAAASRSSDTALAGTTLFAFLVLAALAPLVGVGAAFGPGVDPTYEIGVAAPMRSDRLLFVRATAVLVTSIAIAGAASLVSIDLDVSAALWLLPALGLTLGTLAVATWWRPLAACASVGVAWLAVAAYASIASTDPLAAFHAGAQFLYLVTIIASVLVLARRHDAYEGKVIA